MDIKAELINVSIVGHMTTCGVMELLVRNESTEKDAV